LGQCLKINDQSLSAKLDLLRETTEQDVEIMSQLLHTERLSLRPCQMSDLDGLHQLWTEANIRRFLFDDRQITNEEAKSFIEASMMSFDLYGYGMMLMYDGFSSTIDKSLLRRQNRLLKQVWRALLIMAMGFGSFLSIKAIR
jgi:RimJ/RimL family protein N-acetyltransferase